MFAIARPFWGFWELNPFGQIQVSLKQGHTTVRPAVQFPHKFRYMVSSNWSVEKSESREIISIQGTAILFHSLFSLE